MKTVPKYALKFQKSLKRELCRLAGKPVETKADYKELVQELVVAKVLPQTTANAVLKLIEMTNPGPWPAESRNYLREIGYDLLRLMSDADPVPKAA
jgi:hypothetical protein